MRVDHDTIVTEACDWIAHLQRGEINAKESRALEDWMSRSPQHRATIQHLAQEWQAMNVLTDLAVPHPRQERSVREATEPLSSAWSRGWWTGWVAGVCTLMVAVFWLSQSVDQTDYSLRQAYSTQRGMPRNVALPDGTIVAMNSGSSLSVDYSSTSRNIRLFSGEAHFEVAKDLERPFRVYAGSRIFSAVGTAFSVRLEETRVEITVVEGAVSLATTSEKKGWPSGDMPLPSGPQLLGMGDRLVVAENTDKTVEREQISAEDMLRQLAWRDGKVLFSGETMAEVVAELNRHSDARIVIDGDEVASLRIGGAFDIGETQKFLNTLKASFGIQIRQSGDTVFISVDSKS